MKIEIVEDKGNPLLKRREIKFKVYHDLGTPTRKDVRNELVSKLGSKHDLLIIERMRSSSGKRETSGYAKLYESEDRLKEVEKEHIIERNFPKAEGEKSASS